MANENVTSQVENIENNAPSEEELAAINAKLAELEKAKEALLQKQVAYHNKGYVRQDEKEYREFLKADHIITEDDDDVVQNEQTEYLEDLKFLTTEAVLEGKIKGTHRVSDSAVATPCASISYGHGSFDIYIPYFVLFRCDVAKYATPEGSQFMENRIRSMMGAKVKFVVRHIDNKSRTILADRLEALDKQYYNNWVKPFSPNGKPKCFPGALVQGTVIGVSHKMITVTALGIDQILKIGDAGTMNEISWNYITDCRTAFKIGQKVTLKVLSVKEEKKQVYDNKYTLGVAEFSIRQAMPNPLEAKWDSFREGDTFVATVTGQNVRNYFVLLEDKYECMCAKPKDANRQPELGDEGCIVQITIKGEDDNGRKRLWGRFVKY